VDGQCKRFIYPFAAYQTVSLWCNPNEYKPGEFQSFDDLLNPELRGKIGISDPRTPGSGHSMWSHMLSVKDEEYLKKFVAQKLFVTRDLRLLGENLSSGKIAVTLGIGYAELLPFYQGRLAGGAAPLSDEQFYRLENQSEEKVYKLRKLGAAVARKLLGS
jgi:hypothetical protein